MKSKPIKANIDDLESILQSALEFESDDSKLQFEAEMLHLNTMSVIEKLMKECKMNKKDLATELDMSQSFITQLFTAEKLINYKLLARLQRIFKVNFSMHCESCFDIDFDIDDFKNHSMPQAKIISMDSYIRDKGDKKYNLQIENEMVIGQ